MRITGKIVVERLIRFGRMVVLSGRRMSRVPPAAGGVRVRAAVASLLSRPIGGGRRAWRVVARSWEGVRGFRPVHRAADRDPVRISRRRPCLGSRKRRYALHLPRRYTGRRPLPLVMVLHGCGQDHDDIRAVSNFDAIADRAGFIVVYPFVTSYLDIRIENCWGWWLANEIGPGGGEVEDLWQIVEEVKGEFAIDPQRIHIAGLSSGGGMAVAAMVVHSARIASGAVVAGLPYAESCQAIAVGPRHKPVGEVVAAMSNAMGHRKRPVPILIVHSRDDEIVGIRAAENIRDSWATCFGVDTSTGTRERSGSTRGTPWMHTKYRGESRRTVIETLFLETKGHGWYGGNPGKFSYPEAPNVSQEVWRFCHAHPFEETVCVDDGKRRSLSMDNVA